MINKTPSQSLIRHAKAAAPAAMDVARLYRFVIQIQVTPDGAWFDYVDADGCARAYDGKDKAIDAARHVAPAYAGCRIIALQARPGLAINI